MPNGRATKIMIIRHAEKPNAANNGVTEAGDISKHDLIVQGWQRAGALICLFGASGLGAPPAHLARPDFLYASAGGLDDTSSSQRPIETLQPLSRRLGIDIDDSFTKGDEKQLAEKIQKQPGTVLVAWQHEAINDIVEALPGNHTGLPPKWCATRFDLVYVLDWNTATNTYSFEQVPQNLLAGDTDTLMPQPCPPDPS